MIPWGMFYVLFKGRSNLTILMYHRVNDDVSKELAVRNKDFQWQMEYLFRNHYKILSLDEALGFNWAAINKKEKYAVLTFDDGYEDFYDNAFPILYKYNYPSIVYLVSDYIESGKVFWWDKNLGDSKLLSWNQIAELKNSGIVQFGSHSMNHPDFNLLKKDEIRKELYKSQDLLQEKLSQEIKHFSYPRGIVTHCAQEMIGTYYKSAVSIFDGHEITEHNQKNDFMKIKRMPVQRSDGCYLFGPRLKGWLIIEEWIKRWKAN